VAGSPYSITASGAADSDYTISYVSGTLSVTPAPLTITADNQTKVYGAALSALTASYAGFVNGDTAASLTAMPAVSTAATAASRVAGNPFSINASGAVDGDYTISYVSGTLTVTPAPLLITANDQTKVYGAALPALTASYAGFVNGDTSGILATLPTLTTTASASSDVAGNPYTITASGASDSDYTISYTDGSLTVIAAPLTITADNQTKVYGAPIPTLTVSYAGFLNGDTSANLTTLPTVTTIATVGSHVAGDPYDITATGAVDPDYTITYVDGTLTVTPAGLTITADSQTKLYGAALPALTASYTGFVNGDTTASLTTLPSLSTTGTAASHVAGNPYGITASGAVDPDYTINYVDGSLTVTPVALTITADNQTKIYGAPVPVLTASYTGFVNGDTPASLANLPTLSTTATASSHVAGSPYMITGSGAADPDYTIHYVDGALSVTPAPLTITADEQTNVYGAALPTLTASYAGFVNGDDPASLTTLSTLSTNATPASQVAGNPYTVTATGATDTDYSIRYVDGAFIVTPASLIITAADQSKLYGAALPTLTAGYTGFVNGDTPASLTTLPTLSTTATTQRHVGRAAITVTGAVDSDYAISYRDGALTIAPAPLTITPLDQTKPYGGPLPTLTASYTGFVNGDTADSLMSLPSLSTTATAASHVAGSPYAITAIGALDTDYTINYVDGSLTVTPVALTIAADNQTKVYGAALPTLTASYAGFVNGDTPASLTAPPTLSTSATAASHVAGTPYAITATGALDSDYSISYVDGSLTVTPASLTITADGKTKVYGAPLPVLTASYAGFVNGDTSASLTVPPTLSTSATAASHLAGSPYSITAGGAIDADYTLRYVDGLLTVTPAPLTITADNQTKVYGDSLPALTASYTGFVNGDSSASLATLPSLSTTATAASHVAGSPYSITARGAADGDYTISYVDGSLTVRPAPLEIAANDQTKVYGAALPPLTVSYAGFVNGDTPASLATLPALSTTASASSHVAGNPYDITASGAADSDYIISYVDGTLFVTPAPLTITALDQTKVYGDALPVLTASCTGLVNGDTAAAFSAPGNTPPTLTTVAAGSHVGTYAITASAAIDLDYSITYVDGDLIVTPAALTIVADDQIKVYGSALPALTASYFGLVNGDTSESLTTLPTLGTRATASSHVAGNPYSITASGAVDPDYSISYVDGTLTITPAPLTITADNQTKPYGAALPALTASYTGFVCGDTAASLTALPILATTADAASHVAGNPYSITASGAFDSDYTISYVDGSLTVTPVALTITADNQTKVYGAQLPALTASYTGFVNGDTPESLISSPSLTPTATASSHVAGSPYRITASGALDPDYTISYVNGALTVTPVALTITADNQTKVYGAALPTLTASYTGLVNGDRPASLTTPPTLLSTASASSHVAAGPYFITASGAVDSDYTISYVDGSLVVTPASLTITPDNHTKLYSAPLPALTASYSGFVNGDSPASLTDQPTLSTTGTASSHVAGSPYTVTASGAVDSDYAINYVDGALTVTPAPLAITADNHTKVYGAPLPALTASYSGLVNGDAPASLTDQPTLSTTATASSHVADSTYTIAASGAVDSDYAISYVDGGLTVTPAPLTITADNQTKVYGAPLPSLTASYSGLVNGDSPASLTDQPTLSTTVSTSSHVADDPYIISAGGALDPDYTIHYVNGVLSVTPASLTITADDQSKVYGAPLPVLSVSYAGFVNEDSSANLTSLPTVNTTATAASHVAGSPYSITASGAVDSDYTIASIDGTLSVTPAALTITAKSTTKTYGAPVPALGASYTGFVNADTAASLTTELTLNTVANSASHVSGNPYPIVAAGAGDPDYTIRFVNGALIVTPATLTITASAQTMVSGSKLPPLTASYAGFVNGDTPASLATPAVLATSASANSPAGRYAINVGGATSADYRIQFVNSTLTVLPKPNVNVFKTTLGVAATATGITLSASVVAASAHAAHAAGMVSFYDGNSLLGTVPLAAGVASLHVGVMSAGSHSFRAIFLGSGATSASGISVLIMPPSPQVVGLSRYGFHALPTELVLKFDGALDPVSAQNVAGYQVVDRLGRRIPIARATYDAATLTVTLVPAQRLDLHRTYTLTVLGAGRNGVRGVFGAPLDGAGNGRSRSDFTAQVTWRALTIPGHAPAVAFVNGQVRSVGGTFDHYVWAVIRATRAAMRSALKPARRTCRS
jgi:hypothetical protein